MKCKVQQCCNSCQLNINMEIILIYYAQWPHWSLCRRILTSIYALTRCQCPYLYSVKSKFANRWIATNSSSHYHHHCHHRHHHQYSSCAAAKLYAVHWFHKALLLIFNSNWRESIAPTHSLSHTDFKCLILSLSNTTFHNSSPHFVVHLHTFSPFRCVLALRCISLTIL